VEYPAVGGPSPRLAITTDPPKPQTFPHALQPGQGRGGPAWVSASGLKGVRQVTLRLGPDGTKVRQYNRSADVPRAGAAESGAAGLRRGATGRDAAAEVSTWRRRAGGSGRGVVREVRGVRVGRELTITLKPIAGEAVLSGVEVVAEGW